MHTASLATIFSHRVICIQARHLPTLNPLTTNVCLDNATASLHVRALQATRLSRWHHSTAGHQPHPFQTLHHVLLPSMQVLAEVAELRQCPRCSCVHALVTALSPPGTQRPTSDRTNAIPVTETKQACLTTSSTVARQPSPSTLAHRNTPQPNRCSLRGPCCTNPSTRARQYS